MYKHLITIIIMVIPPLKFKRPHTLHAVLLHMVNDFFPVISFAFPGYVYVPHTPETWQDVIINKDDMRSLQDRKCQVMV